MNNIETKRLHDNTIVGLLDLAHLVTKLVGAKLFICVEEANGEITHYSPSDGVYSKFPKEASNQASDLMERDPKDCTQCLKHPAKHVPVIVQVDSIVFDPNNMQLGTDYCVRLNGKLFVYRKVSDTEIEVYGSD